MFTLLKKGMYTIMTIKGQKIVKYSGLPTKGETSETIVQTFTSAFLFDDQLGNPALTSLLYSYSHRLPALGRCYRKTKFMLLKSIHSTSTLKTMLRTFPWFLRVPNQERNHSRGFMSYDRTSKQRLLLYIYRFS